MFTLYFLGGTRGREPGGDVRDALNPWVRKIPEEGYGNHLNPLLSGESCGPRSLVGYGP